MARRTPERPNSVHDAYVEHGPTAYYERLGHDYRNPHEPVVSRLIEILANEWSLDVSHVLDLAAGSGEVTLALENAVRQVGESASREKEAAEAFFSSTRRLADSPRIEAIDPYTGSAYAARVGRPCENLSFEQIAAGGLRGRSYSMIVCSFALHLAEPSRLPGLCWELAGVADQLLILTPHKRPVIDPTWGWRLTHERVHQRVRARFYAVQPAAKGLL